MLTVKEAHYVDGYRIRVRFDSGDEGVVDLADTLWGPVFEPLKDPAVFRRFQVSDVFHTICWENGADLAPEAIYRKMIEQSGRASPGRVPAETVDSQ
jgi:hypothetical protein